MQENEIKHIQDLIGYKFKNQDLLVQAFTRRSYSQENGGEDNEVLEFIGDKALDIVIVKLLSERFGYFPEGETSSGNGFSTFLVTSWDVSTNSNRSSGPFISEISEGELTEIKSKLVKKSTLSDAIYNLDLESYLIMGEGDIKNNVQNSQSVKEDLFEAIIGAITIDSNWNLDVIQDSVEVMLNPDELMEAEDINYISEINEWTIDNYETVPRYCIVEDNQASSIYFIAHPYTIRGTSNKNSKYTCELILGDIDYHFVGYGSSKSEAKKQAAILAYEYLDKNNMLFSIKDEIENPNRYMAINQLEILSRRGYFSLPTYDFYENHDNNGNPIWRCECHIEDYDDYFEVESSSKKDAKKDAAWEMLQYVLDITP